jgi:GT2 family glycosyltransferase/tetratricopeptide (TPR) repeat protein
MPDQLASLVILCCNEVTCSRLCLNSVLRHTRTPYELILIDNGSTDDTPELLRGYQHRPGPQRVQVIRNETNLGFACGCNQGIRLSEGALVVLLNNDTVVTPGWLEGLTRHLEDSGPEQPSVGLVGPLSNYAAPPQKLTASYTDLAGLDAFALQHRQTHPGRGRDVPRLTGFCLLIRREVIDQVGLLDERFGPGFFDDDDLCLRARDAGFRLRLAQDVYIHHFGNRTFQGLGLDAQQLLRENFARFRDKWGPERTAHYHPPQTPDDLSSFPRAVSSVPVPPTGAFVTDVSPVPASQASRQRVSLCMIVKDEEHNLPDCLRSVLDLVDEAIVVDTGSTDRTRDMARSLGPQVKVFDFPWCDDFAAARNFSLDLATGDWVFWLDADDRVDAPNAEKLRQLFARLDSAPSGYLMRCLCPPGASPAGTGSLGESSTVVDHLRLFRRLPGLRWQYRVHEQILMPLRRLGGKIRRASVTIEHVGYQDPDLRKHKLERDLRLLRLDAAEHPDDPYVLFNLGWVHLQQGHAAEAVALLERGRQHMPGRLSIVAKLHALLVHARLRLNQTDEALRVCQEGQATSSDDPELLFLEGAIRQRQGDHAGAESCFLRLLATKPGGPANSLDLGLWGHKARQNLALVYRALQRPAEEETQWCASLDACPGNGTSLLGLGEFYLTQGRDTDLGQLLDRMRPEPRNAVEVALLEGQLLLRRRDFAAARAFLEQAQAAHPQVGGLRVLLAHALARTGEQPRAEQLARTVLAAEPDNLAARQFLERSRPQAETAGV